MIDPKAFLGDAAFDSIEIYKYLLQEASFEKAYIPLNGRLSLPESDRPLNEDVFPCCPKDPWNSTYKIRVNVEKSINHFKDSFCVAGRKTRNEKTLHTDLLLAGITQLVTVLVADKIHKHQYIRSLKPLIA